MIGSHRRHYLTAFLLDFAAAGGLTAVPLFVITQLGGGARMSGVIGGTQAVAYALVSLLISAPFATHARSGRGWVMVGIPAFAVLFCLSPLIRNAYLYGAVSAVGVGCLALVWPAIWASIGAHSSPKVRARRIGYYNVSWSAGAVLGPLLVAPLYDVDYRLPFVCVFAVACSALLVEWMADRGDLPATAPSGPRSEMDVRSDRASDVYLYSAWCASFLVWLYVGAAQSVYVKHLEELIGAARLSVFLESSAGHVPALGFAALFACLTFTMSLSRAAVFLFMGRFHFWQHRFSVSVALQVAAAGTFWVLSVTHSLAILTLCFAILGAASGGCFAASVNYSLANPLYRRRRAALNEATVGAGVFIGAMGFGLLAGRFGIIVPFRYAPLAVVPAVLCQYLLLRYGARRARIHSQEPSRGS